MERWHRKKVEPVLVITLNILLIIAVISMLTAYIIANSKKLYEQNINDISNVNMASAKIASELSSTQEKKLNNILKYLSEHPLTKQELMNYVMDANADTDVTYQLINPDYAGNVIDILCPDSFPQVSYVSTDYAKIQKVVDGEDDKDYKIPITVEFTDPYSGERSFARYVHIVADDGGLKQKYTLMAVYKSEAFIDRINLDGGFKEMSSVLINHDGSYALRNIDYKSENFMRYLYVYNDLSIEQMNAITKEINSREHGLLQYKNSKGQDCAFTFSKVPRNDWYCVSCVPLSSFHSVNPDLSFTAVLTILLMLIMAIDLSYLWELNKRLKISAKEANAANEAKTDFLARMSHDIRTPINVITGMTELALMEDNPQATKEDLLNIQSSSRFLLGIVNDVLDMNKVESGKMELNLKPYAFSEFLAYLNAVIRPLCAEKDIQFIINENLNRKAFILDSLRINQIFFNLLSNAVKFTPEGGHITVNGNYHMISDYMAAIDLEVMDDGVGMSEEFQKVMFNTFTQEARSESLNPNGTGLGLAIVKRIVNLMNGTISVVSKEGKGTAFYIHLEAELIELQQLEIKKKRKVIELAGKHILLCEDHPLNAKIIIQLLSKKSILVDSAENGKVGVEKFKASEENYYDAILMDIRMPVMDGLEASRLIRAMKERSDAITIPIIALTANAYDSDVKLCMDAGMSRHLPKPIDIQKLCEILAELSAK